MICSRVKVELSVENECISSLLSAPLLRTSSFLVNFLRSVLIDLSIFI